MRRFVAAFFRHPFTLILPAILIPLIVVFAVRSLSSSYTSAATIFITNNPYVAVPAVSGSAYDTPAQNLQNSISEYMTHNSFLLSVANHTDMPKTYKQGTAGINTLMELRIAAGLTMTAVGSETLDIQYSDSNPHVAAQVITALLQQYLTQSIQDAENTTQNTIAIFQQKLSNDEAQLQSDDEKINQYVQQHPNTDPSTDSNLAVLQTTYQNDLAQVTSDQQQLQKLNSSTGIIQSLYTFEVTDPPTIPTTPTIKSKTTLTAMIGGVALGLG
ncbi:MAG TPA: hypothetical protein VH590_08665, partial [Ktedonobacterales bacterium]